MSNNVMPQSERTDVASPPIQLHIIDLVLIFSDMQCPPKISCLGERIDAFIPRKDPMREKFLFRIQKT